MDNRIIPSCHGPAEQNEKPKYLLPTGSWDTHFHVLGPTDRFPYWSGRRYTPPDASLEESLSLHKYLGIDRGILVHANTHGLDNSPFLEAVERSKGKYFGVLRLSGTTTGEYCQRVHKSGIRGARFAFNSQHGGNFNREEIETIARLIEPLGWFLELHFDGKLLPILEVWIGQLPGTIVIDHVGRVDISKGAEGEEFQALLRLARKRNIWVKLSGIDRLSSGYPFEDIVPLTHRLFDFAPDRIIWGSDWPHTGYLTTGETPPQDNLLVDALDWLIPDYIDVEIPLVRNPARLLDLSIPEG